MNTIIFIHKNKNFLRDFDLIGDVENVRWYINEYDNPSEIYDNEMLLELEEAYENKLMIEILPPTLII